MNRNQTLQAFSFSCPAVKTLAFFVRSGRMPVIAIYSQRRRGVSICAYSVIGSWAF